MLMSRRSKKTVEYTKRAVGYCRLSKEGAPDGSYGLDAQRTAIESWATANGFQIASWGQDEGVSGDTPPDLRSGLTTALADLQPGDTLVVARRDRLSRDLILSLALERELLKTGNRIAAADGAGNGNSAEDELMRSMLGAMAQYERRLISMRTKAALARAKAAGKRIGGAKVEDSRPELVERLVAMKLLGLSYPAMCKQLMLAGIKPERGQAWYPMTIKRILDRSVKKNEG